MRRKILFEAHQGVATECPGNTMSAFYRAVQLGYDMIELDPSYTKDGKFVVLHDRTLNRTGRLLNGDALKEDVFVSQIDYNELSNYEFGSSFDKKFLGEKIPLMEEVLALSKKTGVRLKIDNKFENFPEDVKENFLKLLTYEGAHVGLTLCNPDSMIDIAKRFPRFEFHYDGLVNDETLKRLSDNVGKDRLTVWVPYENDRTSWVSVEFANKPLADNIKKYAKLGVWLLTKESELKGAKDLGADVIETDGSLKPLKGE